MCKQFRIQMSKVNGYLNNMRMFGKMFFRNGHTSYLEGERCNAKFLRYMNKLRTVFQLEPLTNVYTPFM